MMIAIRKYRKQKNWSQVTLAEKLGVGKTTISMWETGERKPNIIVLKKLSKLFDCTADALLETVREEEEKK